MHPLSVLPPEPLHQVAAALERRLAERIEQHPEAAAGNKFASSIVAEVKRAAETLDRMETLDRPALSIPGLPLDRQGDLIAISEYLVDAYLRLAEKSTEANMLSVAQDLAAAAVYRLATLSSVGTGIDDR